MEKNRYCTECGKETKQKVVKYDPSDTDSADIWQCLECNEFTDFVN